MRVQISKHRALLSTAALMGVTAFGIVGCSSNDSSPYTSNPNGHAIGWRDTPPPTKAPPPNVPGYTPVSQDGSTSYAQPTNPLPVGGLPPQAPPKQQQINNQPSP